VLFLWPFGEGAGSGLGFNAPFFRAGPPCHHRSLTRLGPGQGTSADLSVRVVQIRLDLFPRIRIGIYRIGSVITLIKNHGSC
jgi:hypothetical protein